MAQASSLSVVSRVLPEVFVAPNALQVRTKSQELRKWERRGSSINSTSEVKDQRSIVESEQRVELMQETIARDQSTHSLRQRP